MKASEVFALLEQGKTMVRTYNDGSASTYKLLDGMLHELGPRQWNRSCLYYKGNLEESWSIKVKTFDFNTAMQKLVDGKKVARQSWSKGIYYFINFYGTLKLNNRHKETKPPDINKEEIQAKDWHEVEK